MLNPLNYTNKTYATIYREIKTRFPNKPDWFIVTVAGLFDVLHWYLDARAQNLLLPTAFTEEAVYDLCTYLDYYLSPPSPATGEITVTVDGGSLPKTILKGDLTFTITDADGNAVSFEAQDDLTIPGPGTSGNVSVAEGVTITDVLIGTSDGVSGWQEFLIPQSNVLPDTVVVSVNSVDWTLKNTLVNSGTVDQHFTVVRKPDGFFAVLFGDGTYGAIPGPFPVIVSFRQGGGVIGNVKTAGSTVTYTGGDGDVTGVAMVADFTGGAAGESLERAKFLAPKMLKRNDRAVTEEDYTFLALKFSTAIVNARAFPGLYGAGTVAVHLVPAGGGNPSSTLKTDLETYLRDRSVLNLADVRVRNPIYVSQDATAQIKMRPGYSFATWQNYATFAMRMLISERCKEIIDIFTDTGIADAVTYINSAWGYTFSSADYAELSFIIQRQKRDGYIDWGTGLRPNDIISVLDSLTGVDYATCSLPVAPVAVQFNEIMTDGTMTVTQIV